MILNIKEILKPKYGKKIILIREKDVDKEFLPNIFYVKDWSLGTTRDNLRYIRYTQIKGEWKKKSYFIKDDSDLTEMEIAFDTFDLIDKVSQ